MRQISIAGLLLVVFANNLYATAEGAVQEAKFSGTLRYSEARKLAIENILEDSNHAESPLAIVSTEIVGTRADHIRELKKLMEHKSTIFTLVSEDCYIEPTTIFPPEQGESLQTNWVFFLSIPSFSDHLYWVVVNRNGLVKPYNYGFN